MTEETAGDAPQEWTIVEIMGLRNGEVIWTGPYQTGALIYHLRLWSEETTRPLRTP